MAKIKLVVSATIEESFSDFIISKKAKGLAEKTLQSYQSQFGAVARHLDVKMDIAMPQNPFVDFLSGQSPFLLVCHTFPPALGFSDIVAHRGKIKKGRLLYP